MPWSLRAFGLKLGPRPEPPAARPAAAAKCAAQSADDVTGAGDNARLAAGRQDFVTAGYQTRLTKPISPKANARRPNASPISPTKPMLPKRRDFITRRP